MEILLFRPWPEFLRFFDAGKHSAEALVGRRHTMLLLRPPRAVQELRQRLRRWKHGAVLVSLIVHCAFRGRRRLNVDLAARVAPVAPRPLVVLVQIDRPRARLPAF